ncbi:MAG: hypothetical protein H6875_13895 [Hyphomicrobiaceae bacterium]|nr:hypothetical protein [Hyphomicrobiaceae bacterium]
MSGISFRPFVFPVLATATVAGAIALTASSSTPPSEQAHNVPQAQTAIALNSDIQRHQN